MSGESGEVCFAYQQHVDQELQKKASARNFALATRGAHPSGNDKVITISDATVDAQQLNVGANLTICFSLHFSDAAKSVDEFGLGVQIHNDKGRLVALFNTIRDDIFLAENVQQVRLSLPRTCFIPGHYWVSANVCDRHIMFAYDEFERCVSFEVLNEFNLSGIPRWEGEVACEHTWLW